MYGGSGGVGGSRGGGVGGARGGGEGSPDTEETDISGDEVFHHRGSGLLAGAINPLMIQGQGVSRTICTDHFIGSLLANQPIKPFCG